MSRVKWSRKGAKDNRLKLAWSKYYKYVFENQDYYFKQKAYTTYCDGFTKTETIKKETYKNAVRRKKDCYEIRVEKDISSVDLDALATMLNKKYQVPIGDLRGALVKARDYLKLIKANQIINENEEYKLFMKKLEEELQLKE